MCSSVVVRIHNVIQIKLQLLTALISLLSEGNSVEFIYKGFWASLRNHWSRDALPWSWCALPQVCCMSSQLRDLVPIASHQNLLETG